MGQFQKGNPGGPGRPKGSRNRALAWFDTIGAKGTEQAIRALTEKAGNGDTHAAAILLARTWARRRGRPVEFELPPLEKPADLVQAQAALVAAVSRGELTPQEAGDVSALLENQRRAIETHQLEDRIRTLEDGVQEDTAAHSWSTLR